MSDRTGFKIRDCDERDLEAVGRLFERVGARTARSREFLAWHFRPFWKTAAAPYNLSIILNTYDEVVSCYGSIETPLYYFGDTRHFAWSANYLTMEEYRKFGLGGSVFLTHIRKYDLYAAFSPNELSRPLMDICKFIAFGENTLQRYLYPCNWDALLSLADSPELRRSIREQRERWNPGSAQAALLKHAALTTFDDASYRAFWEQCRRQFRITTDRRPDFMQWRYLDIPYFRYHVGAAYCGEEMVGIGIWRYEHAEGITAARLCDFAAADAFAAGVLATLVAEIRKQDVCFIDFFKTGPYFSDALAAAGFFRIEHELENIPTMFAPLAHKRWRNSLYVREQRAGERAPELSDINNYYFTKGDSDRDYPTEYYCQQLRAAAQR